MAGEVVRLNVYDLLDVNKHVSCVGLGVYHSGVEIYGKEYAYGGHEFSTSGVFETPPRVVPGGAKFRECLVIGTTPLTAAQVQDLLRRMSREYLGDRYHLLFKNPALTRRRGRLWVLAQCNHFCEDLCEQLTGHRPPSWVNRLAAVTRAMNTFTPCILPSSVRQLARVATVPALTTAMGDSMPLLPGRPQDEDVDGRATSVMTGAPRPAAMDQRGGK